MKKLIGTLYLALFCLGTMVHTIAQNPMTASQALEVNLKASGEYYKWSAGTKEINGSPYLSEEFSPGMIYWNQVWNDGIDLRYNIYQGNFEARLESGIIVIDPLRNHMDTIKYREEVFVKKYLNVDEKLMVVYLSLLGEQNGYALLKQHRILFKEAVTDTDIYNKARPAEYKSNTPAYYVFKGNDNWRVKGNKDLAEAFGKDAKAVKSYLKENKYNLSREEDLLEAVLYFSALSP